VTPQGAPRKRRAHDWLARRVVPPVAALMIRLLRATVRLRVHGREVVEQLAEADRRYVHVFWHAHLLLMVYSYVGPRLAVMISRHRDGELIARTVSRMGYEPVRGSTTRGGATAWRRLLRALRGGADIAFTPDGPRGPARKVQPGCIVAARRTGIPIVPVAIGADRAWRLFTWDRFIVPKPGARVLMAYGSPVLVGDDEPLDDACARLERVLSSLERFAEANASDASVGRRLRWLGRR